jgi:hypothetical protein
MRRVGYYIHAIQIPYLTVCGPSDHTTASCYTDDQSGIRSLEQVDLSVKDKVIIIYKIYGSLSAINGALEYLNGYIQRSAVRYGWRWPDWWSNEQGMAPVRALTTLSDFGDQVATVRTRANVLRAPAAAAFPVRV